MAGDGTVLSGEVQRYLALRRSLGYRLAEVEQSLRAFAKFAEAAGDTHVRAARALEWASMPSTPLRRGIQLRTVVLFAAFLRAEDPEHELPSTGLFPTKTQRQAPYIYSRGEVVQLIEAAGRLHRIYPLRCETYATLFGLIASTGLRISEALDLKFEDMEPDGDTLVIRKGKFGKARCVPLHPTVAEVLGHYIDARRRLEADDRHLFLSARGRRISGCMADYTFRVIAKLANIETGRARPCRIHDLRHTFATRSLEACTADQGSVAEHFVALSTYMGHTDIKHTYWYFEATPELMAGMAWAAEALMAGEGR